MAAKVHQKVVIRHLPPDLPEAIFWQTVDPLLVNNGPGAWRFYCPGRLRQDSSKDHIYSRAYVEFTNDEVLLHFSRNFDGHVFVDKKGNRTQARVELAPYFKIPSAKRRLDPRQGSIEEDPDYVSFVENLSKPVEVEPTAITAPIDPKMTPLLEYLRKQRSAKSGKTTDRGGAGAHKTSAKGKAPEPRSTDPEAKSETGERGQAAKGKKKRANRAKDAPADPKVITNTGGFPSNTVDAIVPSTKPNEASGAPSPARPVSAENPEKRPRPPKPRKEAGDGVGDVAKRLAGGVLGGPSGGKRMAARRAAEKAAEAAGAVDPGHLANEAPPNRGGSRGRGRGRGRGLGGPPSRPPEEAG